MDIVSNLTRISLALLSISACSSVSSLSPILHTITFRQGMRSAMLSTKRRRLLGLMYTQRISKRVRQL